MDAPFYIRSFYKELIALYKKYDLSISHEDSNGEMESMIFIPEKKQEEKQSD